MRIKINKNGKETIIDINNKYIEEVEEETNVEDLDDNIIYIGKNKKKNGKSFKSKFTSALPLMCVVAYLLLGFLLDLWHPGWLVFLLIPILPTFFNVFSKNKKSSWMSLIVLLTVAIYLTVGFVFQLWHPNWIIFFIIPIASIFID